MQRKKGNGRLGYRKIGQPENSATKNRPVGKKEQHKVIVRILWKEWQRYFRLQKKMATGKMSNKKWATDINGEETVTRRWSMCRGKIVRVQFETKVYTYFQRYHKFPCTRGRISLQTQLAPSNSFDRAATRHPQIHWWVIRPGTKNCNKYWAVAAAGRMTSVVGSLPAWSNLRRFACVRIHSHQ